MQGLALALGEARAETEAAPALQERGETAQGTQVKSWTWGSGRFRFLFIHFLAVCVLEQMTEPPFVQLSNRVGRAARATHGVWLADLKGQPQ